MGARASSGKNLQRATYFPILWNQPARLNGRGSGRYRDREQSISVPADDPRDLRELLGETLLAGLKEGI